MDHNLLEIIACPVCKGKLNFDKSNNELICNADRLAYPITEGIPVLLQAKARQLTSEELAK
ncbi:Trm112 family protein [Moritella marina]|uniref:Trm112 family protein n=1 Tax=Moritella marina TaxID=90736 RepID=UPI000474F6B1